jgi:hypothetical protein
MRMLATAFVVLVLLSAPATAKELWHQRGEIIDANGVLVGAIVGFSGPAPTPAGLPQYVPPVPGLPVILLQVNGVTFPLRVLADSFDGVAPLMFLTEDCTGHGYIHGPSVALFAGTGVSGGGFLVHTFEAVEGQAVSITARSVAQGGGCAVVAAPGVEAVGFPATPLVDFTGRWTPPFRIR